MPSSNYRHPFLTIHLIIKERTPTNLRIISIDLSVLVACRVCRSLLSAAAAAGRLAWVALVPGHFAEEGGDCDDDEDEESAVALSGGIVVSVWVVGGEVKEKEGGDLRS